jgi:hypothetical protein
MVDVFAGCLTERLPGPRAAEASRFFEYAPRPPLPSFSAMARFQKQRARALELALVCPRSTWQTPQGPMRPGPSLDAGLEWLRRAADILEPVAIVVASGAELTTGERDRKRLADFLEPLESDAPEGDVVYGRIRPMGARPRLTDGHLHQIAARATAARCKRAYLAVASDTAFRDMKRLQAVLAQQDLDDSDDSVALDE